MENNWEKLIEEIQKDIEDKAKITDALQNMAIDAKAKYYLALRKYKKKMKGE